MTHTKKMYWNFILLLCTSAGLVKGVDQLTIPQLGVVPNGFYEVSKIETIDAVNGSVSLHIPLASLFPGRAGFTYGIELLYNSQIYTSLYHPDTASSELVNASTADPTNTAGWSYGWEYSLVTDIGSLAVDSPPTCASGQKRLRLVMPDGSSHILYPATGDVGNGFQLYNYVDCGGPFYQSGTFYTADSTYLRVNVVSSSPSIYTWTVYFPDGRTVTYSGGVETIMDRNGNKVTISRIGASTTLTDDLNRTVTVTPSTSPLQDVITQTGYNGLPLQWTVHWTSVTLPSSPAHNYIGFGGSTGDASGLIETVVSSIDLPSGLTYQFDSDVSSGGWGQLSQMTLPTGAYVNYTYSNNWDYLNLTQGAIATKTLHWTDQEDGGAPRSEETLYGFTTTSSTFTNPDGGSIVHSFYDITPVSPPDPKGGLVYMVTQPDGSTIERIWNQNIPYGADGCGSLCNHVLYHFPGNPYVQTEFKSVASSGSPSLASRQFFTYDRNGNPTEIDETDWFSYGNITHTSGVPTGLSTTPTTLRTTNTSYVIAAGAATTDYTLVDGSGYWNALAYQLLSFPSRSEVGPGSSSVTEFTYDYGGTFSTANVTEERDYDSTKAVGISTPLTSSNAVVIDHAYDSYGNLTSTTNARGAKTMYTYDSSAVFNCGSGITSSALYISKRQATDTDGTTVLRTFTYQHDCSAGVLTSETDSDHSVTRNFDYDEFGRNKYIRENSVRETYTTYDDSNPNRNITTYNDLTSYQDHGLSRIERYDELGRLRETLDAASNLIQHWFYIAANTGYTYELVSNPFVTGSESTMGWTRTKLDNVGRVVEVSHFSGSTTPSPWSGASTSTTGSSTITYSTDTTNLVSCNTTADEANNSRKSCTDGLGRLVQVIEDPGSGHLNYVTSYGYDPLDNLILVCQGGTISSGSCTSGSIGRSFTYSSLKRLVWAYNPENSASISNCVGTTTKTASFCYTYDANGNLLTRIDARNIKTTLTYNGLDQVLSKTYDDTPQTPTVGYTYSNSWLTQVTSSGGSTYNYTAFDGLGRVTAANQVTNGQTYAFSVTHHPFVGVKDITNPGSLWKFTTGYDTHGRATTISGQLATGTPRDYVTATTYQPHGAILEQTLANGLVVSRCNGSNCDNSRLQPTYIHAGGLLTLGYTYSATQNNGNVLNQSITRGTPVWNQTYAYDALNRLTCATENTVGSAAVSSCTSSSGNWRQIYCYDTRGNRWLTSGSSLIANDDTPSALDCTSTSGSALYTTGNRISCSGCNWAYDNAGNVTTSGTPRTFTYDAENRQKSAYINSQATVYSYDGDGRRVMSVVCPSGISVGSCSAATTYAVVTVFVYDPFGNLAQEYGTPTDFGTKYLTTDALGSTRMVANGSGSALWTYDYLPFGEELQYNTNGRTASTYPNGSYPHPPSGPGLEFTSKERDAETGLDYFGARYMSSAQGRFTSPDPLGGSLLDPQTLNKYTYVRNNPLILTDPTGMYTCKDDDPTDGSSHCTSDQDKAFEAARQNDLRSKDQDVTRAAKAYGDRNIDNGVNVGFANLGKKNESGTTTSTLGADASGNLRANSNVVFDLKVTNTGGSVLDATVGHEGSHVADAQAVVNSIVLTDPASGAFTVGRDISQYASEQRAYHVTDSILRSENTYAPFPCGVGTCQLGNTILGGQVRSIVDQILRSNYTSTINHQPLTEKNPGASIVPR